MSELTDKHEPPEVTESRETVQQGEQSNEQSGFEDDGPTPWSGDETARTPGEMQEQKVRDELTSRGYDQRYGTTDDEIRRNLGFNGRCADFVGCHEGQDQWLIAESKGGDLGKGVKQLENTNKGLKANEPGAVGNTTYEIHMNGDQFDRLSQNDGQIGGFYIQGGFLQYQDEVGNKQFKEIDDARITVRKVE